MIYTVTVNPAMDVTLECEEAVAPGTARPTGESRHAGGKGIDVSRVIRELGGRSVATGLLGGYTGQWIEGKLLQDGLEIDFVPISQETRTNVVIIAGKEKLTYRYNAPGPGVQPIEYLNLYRKIRELERAPQDRRPTYAAICGALSGSPLTGGDMGVLSYVSIISLFRRMGAITVLDTSGKALKKSMQYAPRPHIIKPNIAEFNGLIDDRLMPTDAEQIQGPQKEKYLREQCNSICGAAGVTQDNPFWGKLLDEASTFVRNHDGLEAAMISLGAAGMLLVQRDKALYACLTFAVDVVHPVGAGDAALGGFLFARDRGDDWGTALRFAVAAGAAAVTMPGTEAPSASLVHKFAEGVRIYEVSP